MNTLISAQEAFEAMLSGKNIMCRVAGEMLDFNDLDQFPATVFAKTGYEFCIKIEMINVAGIEFTKPLSLDEYQEGQDVFIINTYDPSIYVVNFKTNALIESINSGFVQRDAENAKLQLKALSKILGCELNDLSIVRLGEEPKKTASKRKSKSTGSENKLTIVEQGPIDVVEDSLVSNSDIETDPAKLMEKFTADINACITNDAVLSLRHVFLSNGYLEKEQHQYLCKLVEDKLLALDPEQYTPKPAHNELSVAELQRLQKEAEDLIESKKLLDDLINRANNAETVAEANALVRYTRTWTEEQRKPLMQAINTRLIELNNQNKPENIEPPSLMVQIQNAPDLTTLDALEIDVASRHPDIQPKLMSYVLKRRNELESVS